MAAEEGVLGTRIAVEGQAHRADVDDHAAVQLSLQGPVGVAADQQRLDIMRGFDEAGIGHKVL